MVFGFLKRFSEIQGRGNVKERGYGSIQTVPIFRFEQTRNLSDCTSFDIAGDDGKEYFAFMYGEHESPNEGDHIEFWLNRGKSFIYRKQVQEIAADGIVTPITYFIKYYLIKRFRNLDSPESDE